jgi:PAS domain S-box-containing protein
MLNTVSENRWMHLTSPKNHPESMEGLLYRAVEALPDCFIVTDRFGIIQYANSAAAQLLRRDRLDAASLTGQSITTLLVDSTTFGTVIRHALMSSWQGEMVVRRSNGQVFTAGITASGIKDPIGQPTAISFIIRDITPQKQREQELERSNRVKSDFLAHMSHELRTPLTSILGFSSVLEKQVFGLLNPKQTQYVTQIHRSGRYLLSLINDVLDLSKIEAGQMELDVQPALLNEVCQSAIDLVSVQAKARNITIEFNSVVMPEVGVDELRLRQVLINLLANAIKFSHEGGNIRVAILRQADTVEIAVLDEGIGIPTNQQHRLFQAFQQVDVTHSRMGTGLGLALSRRLVELHDGSIRVESQPDQGSCFTVCLPIVGE